MRITVWNENVARDPGRRGTCLGHYPDGIHAVIAAGLAAAISGDAEIRTATLQEPEHGLTEEVLATPTCCSGGGTSRTARSPTKSSSAYPARAGRAWACSCCTPGTTRKVFKGLIGTTCALKWRETTGAREPCGRCDQRHPIAQGVCRTRSSSPPGDVREATFRPPRAPTGGSCLHLRRRRGLPCPGVALPAGDAARVPTFSPGDQEYPVYHHPDIRRAGERSRGCAANDRAHAADRGSAPTGLVVEHAGVKNHR